MAKDAAEEEKDTTTATVDGQSSQETADKAKDAEQADEKDEVLPEGVTKNEKGVYEFVVDPDDSQSTRYEGKDITELMANIRKGTKEKDTFIRKLRADQVSADSHRGKSGVKGEGDTPDVEYPDAQKIINESCKERNVDPKMVGWTNAQWKQYADEHELRDFEIIEMKQGVREAVTTANAKIAEGNVNAINNHMLDEETAGVKMLLAKSGVDIEKFNYEAVLKAVYENPKNFQKTGIRIAGTIVAEAAEAITALVREGASKKAKTETEERIASGAEAKKRVTAQGPSRQEFKPSTKASKDFEEVTRTILAGLDAGRYKTD